MRALALVLVLAGCAAGTPRREEVLIQNARAFNDDLRWGRWDAMAGTMPREEALAFLERARALEPELVVADFEVGSIDFQPGSEAANVTARFEWYLKRDPVIRNTTILQRWEFQEGRWQVTKLRRTRGDRFGLITEPARPPEAAGAPAP